MSIMSIMIMSIIFSAQSWILVLVNILLSGLCTVRLWSCEISITKTKINFMFREIVTLRDDSQNVQ